MPVKLLSVVCHLLLGSCVSRVLFTTEKKGLDSQKPFNCGGRVVTLPDKVAALQFSEKQLNTFLYKKTVNDDLTLSAFEYL